MTKRELIISEFLDKNPEFTADDIEFSEDGRLEWFCEHGQAHTVFSPKNSFWHQCCGCCRKIIPLDRLSRVNHTKILKKKVAITGV